MRTYSTKNLFLFDNVIAYYESTVEVVNILILIFSRGPRIPFDGSASKAFTSVDLILFINLFTLKIRYNFGLLFFKTISPFNLPSVSDKGWKLI